MHRLPRWPVVFLLFSGTFINALDRASLSTAAPMLMRDLGLDLRTMGIALSAFFWFYTLMNIPAGRLADRYGAKPALGFAACLWSLCSAATGLASNFWSLIVARAGVGIGESACFPVNAKIVNRTFAPHERGMVTGFYGCGSRLGFAAAPVVMAVLMARFGWRVAFFATGIGSLFWVVLWYLFYEPGEMLEKEGENFPKQSCLESLNLRGRLMSLLRSFALRRPHHYKDGAPDGAGSAQFRSNGVNLQL